MSEYTIGTYISYTITLVFGPIAIISGGQMKELVANFERQDWLLCAILGVMSVCTSLMRSKST